MIKSDGPARTPHGPTSAHSSGSPTHTSKCCSSSSAKVSGIMNLVIAAEEADLEPNAEAKSFTLN